MELENLQVLFDLLSLPAKEESDAAHCKNVNPMAKIGPGHISTPSSAPRQDKNAVNSAYVNSIKDIWDMEEVTEETHFDLADPRPQPDSKRYSFEFRHEFDSRRRYEIMLKQSVRTEDLFLGMSQKDPSSMCCESMLVRVKLPETQVSDIVLDMKERFVDLRTPKYKLGLHLPHSLQSTEGTARFITERYELEITLPMNRPQESIILT